MVFCQLFRCVTTPYMIEIVELFFSDFDEGSFRRKNRIW